ncbi:MULTISPECIES: SPOR domain-containing protein [unclassified Pseudomonas]|uniref:SPOR domain-containing protein n=1 Tax=unclassified Pseudomonas TaxID=196821 RepID=UPI000BC6B6F9|nr:MULTISPECIES: SPOR domain-containing protein [unclassified Pseudomonas]PVZ16193.1 DedD protein [Pseudomonas sp. URIL14HWK12:I12]PVZ25951.1 DedD protein [Pseudomonas sp. URIL14HWK12:I10]PVZ36525.1 DedD protein [Pseudomonas sp. URIL14HWK12:I11]SNZ13276.1 DedD protein [Pseudomonas sp. URIL14HWK12:I9]
MLDSVVKQRMVGAVVLIALAVIFLPMLFSRPDEMRQVRVDAPAAPSAPALAQVKVEPVAVPENSPVAPPAGSEQAQADAQPITTAPSMPVAPAQPVASKQAQTAPAARATTPLPVPPAPPAQPVQATAPVAGVSAKPDGNAKLDTNGVPVSWAIQVASLSTRSGAEGLQSRLRTQGYNAYVRSADGKNRVFVGPVIERAEADRLRTTLNRQLQLNGLVVRFEPEKS